MIVRRRVLWMLLSLIALIALAACVQEKRVDAPVVDLSIPRLSPDASAPLAIGGSSSGTSSPQPSHGTGTMEGKWEGTGFQNDGMSWPMVVELSSSTMNGVCATVDYPSIPCRAEWICTNGDPAKTSAKGTPIQAIERLLGDSATRCIDNGTMTMHLVNESSLLWSWQGQGLTAASQLRRVE